MNEPNFGIPSMRAAMWRCRGELMSTAFFSLFINLLMLTFPIYMLQIFTRVLSSHSGETLVFLTIAAIGALILFGVLSALRARILVRLSAKLDTLLGERVHRAIIARSMSTNDSRNVQALRDLSQVRNFLGGSDIHSLFDAPWTPIFLAVIFILDPLLGVVAAGGALVLFAFAVVNDLRSRKPLQLANLAAQSAYRHAYANVRNAEVIEGMGMAKAAMKRWRTQNAMALQYQGLAIDRTGTISATSMSLRLILQILIFAVGAYLVIDRQASPGVMIAAVILMGRALSPVDAAIRTWRNLLGARAAYQRLEALLKLAPVRPPSMTLPAPKGRLTAEKVFYVPPGAGKPVLKGVSFALEPGESLGIVGPSAAGKSTLAKLIVGVWDPTRGHVRLDGADVSTWDPDDLGQYIGYLPQEVELFGGTIRENIARMNDASPEDIVAAARLADIHDMILDLPDGYETQIGDGGSVLSGGQRQRIALARALFGRPRLLVLDEPNANIDQEGEEALANALAEAKADGTTSVIIAHRPIVLSKVDKILVLRNGRAEMFGPREEIIAKIVPRATRPRIVASDA